MAISDSSKLIPPGEAHLWFRKRLPLKSSQARRRARRSLQSDLRETTIDKQFYSRDVTAFVGREKDNDLSDLVGCAESAELNTVGNRLHVLLGLVCRMPRWRVNKAWAHRVHANAAVLQIHGPRSRERTHSGFGRAVDTVLGRSFTGGDGRYLGSLHHEVTPLRVFHCSRDLP